MDYISYTTNDDLKTKVVNDQSTTLTKAISDYLATDRSSAQN